MTTRGPHRGPLFSLSHPMLPSSQPLRRSVRRRCTDRLRWRWWRLRTHSHPAPHPPLALAVPSPAPAPLHPGHVRRPFSYPSNPDLAKAMEYLNAACGSCGFGPRSKHQTGPVRQRSGSTKLQTLGWAVLSATTKTPLIQATPASLCATVRPSVDTLASLFQRGSHFSPQVELRLSTIFLFLCP